MSSKNINLSEGWVADELYEGNKAPTHLSMRKRITKKDGRVGRYDSIYPDGSYTRQHRLYQYIPRLLEKNLGKSFDVVFSKFCHDYPEMIGELNTREVFKKHFVDYNPVHRWYRPYGTFYIDANGLIQHENKKRKNKRRDKIEFWNDEPAYYYHLNKKFLQRHPFLDNTIYNIIGAKLYDYVYNTEKIPEKVAEKIKYLFLDTKCCHKLTTAYNEDGGDRCYFSIDVFNKIFIRDTDTSVTTLNKGDNKYKQYKAETSDLQKRNDRERKKTMDEEHNNALRLLWEIKEKEKAQNIIDRDRLGFDNMSFKKEKEE